MFWIEWAYSVYVFSGCTQIMTNVRLVLLYRPNSQPFRFWNGKFPFRNLRSEIMVSSWDAHFGNHFRHIITHHKHWLFWIINDHILLIHNILTISLVTISISTIILTISCIFICLFTTQICWAQAYQCWVLRREASSFETGSFPFRNGKLPILALPIL